MILREFLYVDADKVRGLLAQLDEGITEASSSTDKSERVSGLTLKGLAAHSRKWAKETSSQKSLGDTLFPKLEEILHSLAFLTDISEQAREHSFWNNPERDEQLPAGSIVRISAPGSLFDARYFASSVKASFTSAQGLLGITGALGVEKNSVTPPRKGMPKTNKGREGDPVELEDDIPEFDYSRIEAGLTREKVRSLIRVLRAVFVPGLHLNLMPMGPGEPIVTARLQEGKQFLDADPEVLFARYGPGVQEWTVVGYIGHYGQKPLQQQAAQTFADKSKGVNRSDLANYANNFLLGFGERGSIDLPQPPSFSVVPLAVYRIVGQSRIFLTPTPTLH